MQYLTINKKLQSGLTLIELVIVIIVLSILAGIGSAQINSSDEFSLSQQARKFSNHIRHVQLLANNWGCDLRLTVSASNYEVTSQTDYTGDGKAECGAGNVITDPAAFDSFSIDLEGSVTFSSTGNFYFDTLGRPRNSATDALLTATTQFDMSSGSATWRATIAPISGFVTLAQQ